MKFDLPENSVFAVLLRSPWWISLGIGAGLSLAASAVLPAAYVAAGIFAAIPFFLIGGIAAWKQLRVPSAARVAAALDAVRVMSWTAFSDVLEDAFRRDGYGVRRIEAAGADLEITKQGRVTLVGCKRWKAARAGIEPLRDLHAAMAARGAHECLYVSAGELSEQARAFAAEKEIRLLEGAALALLLRGSVRKKNV